MALPPARLVARMAADMARAAVPSAGPVPSQARWSAERARRWQQERGWLVGCNYVPSTASNQLEMWQESTWDPATIDRELGWAADLGFTSLRVFLHDLVFAAEGDGFLDRVDTFLGIADDHGLGTMLVLFDGVWDPAPKLGPQADPVPGVHNSRWVQSPGAEVLSDRSRWGGLRDYVRATVTRFGTDPRVDVWDVFNEPDNPNMISYPRDEVADKRFAVLPLVEQAFDWAAGVDPAQPLTAAPWIGVSGALERVSALNRLLLARSDVISFHSYAPPRRVRRTLDHLVDYHRPVLCTEWMARSMGSTVAGVLPDLYQRGVGAYCWGFVDGRSQTKYPWSSAVRPVAGEPDPWFHDLLHVDGRPYDTAECDLIRAICLPARDGTFAPGP